MPDVNYVITIKATGGSGGSGKKSGKSGSSKKKKEEAVATAPSGESFSLSDAIKGANKFLNMAGTAYALKMADTVTSHNINTVSVKTGNTILQEKLNFNYSVAKSAASLLGGFILSAATGNAVGMALTVGSLAMKGVQIAQNAHTLSLERELENESIRLANIRAGSGGDRLGRNTP